jgi:hypothetical protein
VTVSQAGYILIGVTIGLPIGIFIGILMVKAGLIRDDRNGNGHVR